MPQPPSHSFDDRRFVPHPSSDPDLQRSGAGRLPILAQRDIVGPDFAPPPVIESRNPAQSPAPHSPASRPRAPRSTRARVAMVTGALLLALAVLLGVVTGVGVSRFIDPPLMASASIEGTHPGGVWTPTPTGPPGPVAGATFSPSEPTQAMTSLSGLGFDFRTPRGWKCLQRGAEPSTRTVRWVCLDATAPAGVRPDGGSIRVTRCADACNDDRWRRLREEMDDPHAAWRSVDERTMYSEHSSSTPGTNRTTVMMSRVFASTHDATPDRHVGVSFSAAGNNADLYKIVNDVWQHTA